MSLVVRVVISNFLSLKALKQAECCTVIVLKGFQDAYEP